MALPLTTMERQQFFVQALTPPPAFLQDPSCIKILRSETAECVERILGRSLDSALPVFKVVCLPLVVAPRSESDPVAAKCTEKVASASEGTDLCIGSSASQRTEMRICTDSSASERTEIGSMGVDSSASEKTEVGGMCAVSSASERAKMRMCIDSSIGVTSASSTNRLGQSSSHPELPLFSKCKVKTDPRHERREKVICVDSSADCVTDTFLDRQEKPSYIQPACLPGGREVGTDAAVLYGNEEVQMEAETDLGPVSSGSSAAQSAPGSQVDSSPASSRQPPATLGASIQTTRDRSLASAVTVMLPAGSGAGERKPALSSGKSQATPVTIGASVQTTRDRSLASAMSVILPGGSGEGECESTLSSAKSQATPVTIGAKAQTSRHSSPLASAVTVVPPDRSELGNYQLAPSSTKSQASATHPSSVDRCVQTPIYSTSVASTVTWSGLKRAKGDQPARSIAHALESRRPPRTLGDNTQSSRHGSRSASSAGAADGGAQGGQGSPRPLAMAVTTSGLKKIDRRQLRSLQKGSQGNCRKYALPGRQRIFIRKNDCKSDSESACKGAKNVSCVEETCKNTVMVSSSNVVVVKDVNANTKGAKNNSNTEETCKNSGQKSSSDAVIVKYPSVNTKGAKDNSSTKICENSDQESSSDMIVVKDTNSTSKGARNHSSAETCKNSDQESSSDVVLVMDTNADTNSPPVGSKKSCEEGKSGNPQSKTASETASTAASKTLSKTMTNGAKTFPCPECGKTFRWKRNLTEHTRNVHDGAKNYACSECPKRFSSSQSLKKHVENVHRGKRNHVCCSCQKEFSQKGNLKTHFQTVHQQTKTFSCADCGKKFNRKEHLKMHAEAVHQGMKRFACPECHRKFYQKKSMMEHCRNIHGKEILMQPVWEDICVPKAV